MKLVPSEQTLIIQPLPGIGDMVWHLPHLHAIAATTVSGRIDLLTKPRSQADRLLCADPVVERVLWLDRAAVHAGMGGLWRLTTLLRQGEYQRVWILHGSARYALAARLAGISERISYGVGWQTALLNGPARLPPELRHTHPIRRADALLDLLNIPRPESEPRLRVSAEADQAIAERFAAWPLPWIALGIGSSELCKQWGAARFAELALALQQRQAGSILIIGGPAERALADELLARIHAARGQAVDAVALPLEQTAAVLARCCAYLGNDTGVLNMAAALQTPAIGLFGGSQPLWHSRFIHPITPPEGESGMTAITVPHVLDRYLQFGQLHAHQDCC